MSLLRRPCPSKLLLLAFLSGLLIFLAAAAPSLSQAAPALQEPSPTPEITPEALPTPLPGVPVTLGSETLFYVFQRSGSLTPAERAALLSERIAKLAGDPFAPPLEITTAESAQGIDLLIGDQVLMTITENDASAAGMSRDEAASLAAQTIQDAVHKYRQEHTPPGAPGAFPAGPGNPGGAGGFPVPVELAVRARPGMDRPPHRSPDRRACRRSARHFPFPFLAWAGAPALQPGPGCRLYHPVLHRPAAGPAPVPADPVDCQPDQRFYHQPALPPFGAGSPPTAPICSSS